MHSRGVARPRASVGLDKCSAGGHASCIDKRKRTYCIALDWQCELDAAQPGGGASGRLPGEGAACGRGSAVACSVATGACTAA